MGKIKYKFLILGHPRTGTGYMSKLFQYFGYDVGHEVFGKDGISNWMYSINNIYNMPVWGTRIKRDDNKFKYKLLVIRNPYTSIKSFINTENNAEKSLDYRLKYLNITIEGLNKVETAIYIYDEWIKTILKQYPDIKIIKLENAKDELNNYLINNKFNIKINNKLDPPKNYNTRNENNTYKDVDFNNISDKFKNILKDFCKKYNYNYEN